MQVISRSGVVVPWSRSDRWNEWNGPTTPSHDGNRMVIDQWLGSRENLHRKLPMKSGAVNFPLHQSIE